MASCIKCKALGINSGKAICSLGYAIKDDVMPAENCPRPLTYLQYIELRNERIKEIREQYGRY